MNLCYTQTIYYQTQGLHDRIACVSADRTLVECIYYDRGSKLDEVMLDTESEHTSRGQRPASVALACMLNDDCNFSHLFVVSSSMSGPEKSVWLIRLCFAL